MFSFISYLFISSGPLALTWGGAAGNGAGTINSQKMLPPPPASIHGSNFGTVGAHSYLRLVRRVPRHHTLPILILARYTCTEIGRKGWLFSKLQPGIARKRINAT